MRVRVDTLGWRLDSKVVGVECWQVTAGARSQLSWVTGAWKSKAQWWETKAMTHRAELVPRGGR